MKRNEIIPGLSVPAGHHSSNAVSRIQNIHNKLLWFALNHHCTVEFCVLAVSVWYPVPQPLEQFIVVVALVVLVLFLLL